MRVFYLPQNSFGFTLRAEYSELHQPESFCWPLRATAQSGGVCHAWNQGKNALWLPEASFWPRCQIKPLHYWMVNNKGNLTVERKKQHPSWSWLVWNIHWRMSNKLINKPSQKEFFKKINLFSFWTVFRQLKGKNFIKQIGCFRHSSQSREVL